MSGGSLEDRLAKNLVWKGDCLEWTGTRYKGYGRVYDGTSVKKRAHRVVYSLIFGDIPENTEVRHTCDNPPCCNPEHLILGSHKSNMEDMTSRERAFTKLTAVDVKTIRKRYAVGDVSQRGLAREYKVSHATVNDLLCGRTWKHL